MPRQKSLKKYCGYQVNAILNLVIVYFRRINKQYVMKTNLAGIQNLPVYKKNLEQPKTPLKLFLFLFYLYNYPSDRQESNGAVDISGKQLH